MTKRDLLHFQCYGSNLKISKLFQRRKKKLFFEKEVQTLEKEISERTPTFLLGESEWIHVKLTEKGKEFYRSRLNYRPQKINSESTEDEYVFSCTEQQAYVYFLSFGKDAEIMLLKNYENA